MTEERLYTLAHDSLLQKWGRERDFLAEHPTSSISKHREDKLWNELIELEEEMKVKGYNR